MGRVYAKIMQYLGEAGQFPAGPPYGAYYNMDMDDLDVEIGFPVGGALPGRDEIQSGEMPAGQYAACIRTGAYDQSAPAYEALATFICEQGHEPTGLVYEFYLNDPGEVPPEELQTEIVFALK
jgi:effector-binding domain-containing protein